MEIVDLNENLQESVEKAVEAYHSGKVFIYPTDTIYGFGGDPFNPDVSLRICNIKGRDESKMFIQLVDCLETLLNYVSFDNERYLRLMERIWPDRVSVILNLNEQASSLLHTSTVAFRIPDEKFCRSFLSLLKKPLISTSVNRSGNSPLNDPETIISEFGNEADILYYYSERIVDPPAASTIVDLSGDEPRLIREGSVKYEKIIKAYNL